jgi:tetratricopeptide (TPR) repeat protein/DNA-binding SARP family transcriptional activator
MWFGVLGPLLVRDGDAEVEVPAALQRVLLAALLVHAGQTVPADTLAEVVWNGTPPASAATTLRSHVMRLRRVLGPVAGSRVVTRYRGYLLDAGEQEVDHLRFTSLCRDGGAAVRAGAWPQAYGILGEALGLWRGEPLADIPSQLLHRDEVPRLAQLRLQALEWQVDAGLYLGGHSELVPQLHSLVAQHPLRERFHAQLMLALCQGGRPAEALAAYQDARSVLAEELGTDPGTELRDLHQQILTADPALTGPAPAAFPAGRPSRVVPRELPAPVAHFAGRANELAALTGLLEQSGQEIHQAVVISAIGGTAGVGKTALAVRWAHQVIERFPDGQLYVNLRGYDPGRPVTAADTLAGFLRALGIPARDIPAEQDERAAWYRSLLAGRRVLVILDNARSEEQVRPLLPGTPGCVAVVTSRHALVGLIARDGARRVDLDLLPLADAVSLLRVLIGGRVDADPDAVAVLAGWCCRLPLALRLAAELAVGRPAASLASLVGELCGLAGQQRRLDLLDAGGDPRTAVRAVFSWSYRNLDADTARTFRLAGLHPGADLDPYAAAALTGATLGQAGRMLGVLTRAHLIQNAGPGRYSMHDLLRAYAAEQAAQDGEKEQQAALTRLFDYYLATAAAAADTLFPAERHRRPRILPATPAPPVTDPAAALAWLDEQRATLVVVAAMTAGHGWPSHATRLAVTLYRYLEGGGHYPEAITIYTHARHAAHRTGDHAAEANVLINLGVTDTRMGRYQQATSHYQQALALFSQAGDGLGQARALGNLGSAELLLGRSQQAAGYLQQALTLYRQASDRVGEARALNNLGTADELRGRYQQAADHHRQALDLTRELGDRVGETETLINLGHICERQGRYQQAADHHQQALGLSRQIGHRACEAHALANLGDVSLRQGRYQQAADHHQQALDLSRQIGNRACEIHALINLGDISLRQGRYQQAADHHQQALGLSREIGNRNGEAEALNGLGEVFLATGRPRHAQAQHATALGLASQAGDKYEQAGAHNGLGHAHHAAGDRSQARHHWEQALALFTDLGVPESDHVRAQLTAADDSIHREP